MFHTVTDADTAAALGSGNVPVLATPRLIAWMEAETVQTVEPFLVAGQTTVGTAIQVETEPTTERPDLAGRVVRRQLDDEISGVRRTRYCGAYRGWGFHEDGVVSALRACAGIPGAAAPPARVAAPEALAA